MRFFMKQVARNIGTFHAYQLLPEPHSSTIRDGLKEVTHDAMIAAVKALPAQGYYTCISWDRLLCRHLTRDQFLANLISWKYDQIWAQQTR